MSAFGLRVETTTHATKFPPVYFLDAMLKSTPAGCAIRSFAVGPRQAVAFSSGFSVCAFRRDAVSGRALEARVASRRFDDFRRADDHPVEKQIRLMPIAFWVGCRKGGSTILCVLRCCQLCCHFSAKRPHATRIR